jgi:hypothetical protein
MLNKEENQSLEDYLAQNVFAGKMGTKLYPDPQDTAGFNEFIKRYIKGLAIERAAVDNLK